MRNSGIGVRSTKAGPEKSLARWEGGAPLGMLHAHAASHRPQQRIENTGLSEDLPRRPPRGRGEAARSGDRSTCSSRNGEEVQRYRATAGCGHRINVRPDATRLGDHRACRLAKTPMLCRTCARCLSRRSVAPHRRAQLTSPARHRMSLRGRAPQDAEKVACMRRRHRLRDHPAGRYGCAASSGCREGGDPMLPRGHARLDLEHGGESAPSGVPPHDPEGAGLSGRKGLLDVARIRPKPGGSAAPTFASR